MSSPMTAATNSAVESASTWRMSQSGRDDRQVRQDREADHDPGDDPGGQEGARIRRVGEQLAVDLDGGERETDEAAEGGPKDADVADQRFLERFPASPATDRHRRTVSLASPGPPRHERGGRSASAASIASRSVATATTSSPSIRRTARRRDGRGHDRPPEPEPSGLAQAALEPGDGPQLAEQTDLADGDGPRRDRPVARRRGEGEGERQVERRLDDGQPAGQVGVHVMAAEADPGSPTEDRDRAGSAGSGRARSPCATGCRSRSG